jgi:hypothetical protein
MGYNMNFHFNGKSSLLFCTLLTGFIFFGCTGSSGGGGATTPTTPESDEGDFVLNFAIKGGGDGIQTPIHCVFNGTQVNDGTSVSAYLNSSVSFGQSCESQSRTCTQGVLSGNYTYSNCAVGAPSSCLFNGVTIGHGDSVTAYSASSVPFGSLCSSVVETRTCDNGVLSGSSLFASCAINAPRSCVFDGKTVEHGQSIVAFQSSNVSFGSSCSSEERSCQDGTLLGSFDFGSCVVAQPASCLFDGQTIPHDGNVVAFQASSAPYGSSCSSETRSCQNGQLSGQFTNSTCAVDQPANCTFNNQPLIHGESIIAYARAQVPYGSLCKSQSRTCENGVLTGSHTEVSCVVEDPQSCSFNGQNIEHGGSVLAFTSLQKLEVAITGFFQVQRALYNASLMCLS